MLPYFLGMYAHGMVVWKTDECGPVLISMATKLRSSNGGLAAHNVFDTS